MHTYALTPWNNRINSNILDNDFLGKSEKEDPFRPDPLRNLIAMIIFYLSSLVVAMDIHFIINPWNLIVILKIIFIHIHKKEEWEGEKERKKEDEQKCWSQMGWVPNLPLLLAVEKPRKLLNSAGYFFLCIKWVMIMAVSQNCHEEWITPNM